MEPRRRCSTTIPPNPARDFEDDAGCDWLHLVDLNGAFEGKPVNAAAVEAILARCRMPVQLGGGVRDMAKRCSRLGWRRACAASFSARRRCAIPAFVREACAAFPGRIAVGVDARQGKVAVEGWAETTELSALDLARRFEDAGVAAIIYTDIDRDGAMQGPNVPETAVLGAGDDHPGDRLGRGQLDGGSGRALKACGAPLDGVISGRALYDGRIDPAEGAAYLREHATDADRARHPCLDVKDGRVVKGVNFVDLVDAGDPVESAKAYDAAGADELCFLDISASHRGARHHPRRRHGGRPSNASCR